MAVGTDQGTVYTGQQGTGLATTIKDNYAENELKRRGLEADAKKKAQEAKNQALTKAMEGIDSDVWHFYQNDMAKSAESILEEGAKLMTGAGIDNLWTSTDPAAQVWRSKANQHKRQSSNIKQYKEQYDKAIAAISVREDKYDPEYVKAVKAFPVTNDTEALASGTVQFPTPKFTNPGDLFSGFYITAADDFQRTVLKDGGRATDAQIKEYASMYFSDPSKAADAQAGKQMFEQLSTDDKAYYNDMARRLGYDEGWQAHAHSNFKSRLSEETPGPLLNSLFR